MAATAARASVAVPHATIGAWISSASRLATSSRILTATSTIKRSAPRPERSTASACALSTAWVTDAPLSIAILVAVVSWPLSVPTMRSRMVCSFYSLALIAAWDALRPLCLDDFRHGHAELFLDENDFAARDQAVIHIDVDGLAELAIECEPGAR